MISEKARRDVVKHIKGRIFFDEPMKNHTSIRIGGPVDALITPESEKDLRALLKIARKNDISITVIGNGTKLLVSDKGIDGIAIKISGCFDDVNISETEVIAGGGYSLAGLSRLAADHGLSGLEFAVGIPGTVGGGVVMNAGAHGSMMRDIVTNVVAMNPEGKISNYSKNELAFGYRQSKLQNSKMIVLAVEMALKEDDVERIERKMYEYMEWRKKNQPLNLPNAGSIFKNPTGIPAGKLIDMAGLKGMRLGDAKISEKRANFIVNLGSAAASDVLGLMNLMQREVLQKFGIWLEPEIRFVGRFN